MTDRLRPPPQPTRDLARMAAGVRLEELPATTVEAARLCLLDAAACALVGSTSDVTGILARYVAEVGGAERASLFGLDARSSAENAALVNGASIRVLELDDTHSASGIHAACTVASAALAAAEEVRASGPALLEALVAGYEVALRIGTALMPAIAARGFHPTAVCGALGAAVAAGRLFGLDEQGLRLALGSAATQASGLFQFEAEGGESFMSSPLNAGRAAASGVASARLARLGFGASREVLEGERGFLRAFGGGAVAGARLGQSSEGWLIESLDFTPYACCRHARSPAEAALELRREHRFDMDEIEEIEVRTYGAAVRGACQRDQLWTPYDALLSVSYAVAVALRDGTVSPAQFSSVLVHDPSIVALRHRTLVIEDESLDALFPSESPADVTIRLTDGRRLTSSVRRHRGWRGNAMSDEEWRSKLSTLTVGLLSPEQADRLYDLIRRLDRQDSLAPLFEILGQAKPALLAPS